MGGEVETGEPAGGGSAAPASGSEPVADEAAAGSESPFAATQEADAAAAESAVGDLSASQTQPVTSTVGTTILEQAADDDRVDVLELAALAGPLTM